MQYLFFEEYAKNSNYFSNTGLKPEKSIDYEVGFRQKLSTNMALNIAAYYSEKRDQVQVYRYTEAYPATYYSYTNIDFGTTQGFTIGLEMRKDKHVGFTTNYTLQFATKICIFALAAGVSALYGSDPFLTIHHRQNQRLF